MRIFKTLEKKSKTDKNKAGPRGLTVGKLLIEMVSIVLAVLLALAVDQWREGRSNETLAREALNRIVAELKANVTELEEVLKDHQVVSDRLKNVIEKLEKAEDDPGIQINFNFTLGILKRTAWQTAIVTQAVRYMDFQVVQELSEIYEVVDIYKSHMENTIKNLSSLNLYSEDRIPMHFKALLRDAQTAIDLGEGLLESLRKFLKKY